MFSEREEKNKDEGGGMKDEVRSRKDEGGGLKDEVTTKNSDSSFIPPPSSFIRVLVVDDSSFMRKSLTYILESDNSVKVIDTAEDGIGAIKKVRELHPD